MSGKCLVSKRVFRLFLGAASLKMSSFQALHGPEPQFHELSHVAGYPSAHLRQHLSFQRHQPSPSAEGKA